MTADDSTEESSSDIVIYKEFTLGPPHINRESTLHDIVAIAGPYSSAIFLSLPAL